MAYFSLPVDSERRYNSQWLGCDILRTWAQTAQSSTPVRGTQVFFPPKAGQYVKNSVVDPDPAFHLNAVPDTDPGQTLKLLKVNFLHEKYT